MKKIKQYDTTKTVETAKYGKRAIRATQLNGQNVLNPEPACRRILCLCWIHAIDASSPGMMDVGGSFSILRPAQVPESLPETSAPYQQSGTGTPIW